MKESFFSIRLDIDRINNNWSYVLKKASLRIIYLMLRLTVKICVSEVWTFLYVETQLTSVSQSLWSKTLLICSHSHAPISFSPCWRTRYRCTTFLMLSNHYFIYHSGSSHIVIWGTQRLEKLLFFGSNVNSVPDEWAADLRVPLRLFWPYVYSLAVSTWLVLDRWNEKDGWWCWLDG